MPCSDRGIDIRGPDVLMRLKVIARCKPGVSAQFATGRQANPSYVIVVIFRDDSGGHVKNKERQKPRTSEGLLWAVIWEHAKRDENRRDRDINGISGKISHLTKHNQHPDVSTRSNLPVSVDGHSASDHDWTIGNFSSPEDPCRENE